MRIKRLIVIIIYSAFTVGLVGVKDIGADSAKPALFFSDLESGPKTGWGDPAHPHRGVAVTLWGKNFSTERGASYVTANGAKLINDSDYAEWGVADKIPGLERITFWLKRSCQNGTGEITVTVSGESSNPLPFTVRPGKIYFVDINSPNDPGSGTYNQPWRSPTAFYKNMAPGDTCYFREGKYVGEFGHPRWKAQFCLSPSKSGTPGNPVAFVSYPGEVATFDADSESGPYMNFRPQSDSVVWIVVAKLRLLAWSGSSGPRSNWRFMGNHCEGCRQGGYAIVGVKGENVKILGNELTGGRSGNRLDHAIYPNEGEDVEIAWNYIHDNNFGRGPMISCNHDGAYKNGWVFKNYRIHDNIIDVTTYSSRAIGTHDTGAGSSFYIYNNIIIGEAPDGWASIVAYSGDIYVWNNSIFHTNRGISTVPGKPNPPRLSIINNIIYVRPGADYIGINAGMPTPTIDSNCYYGAGSGPSQDKNPINADPRFIDPAKGDFHLKTGSPCIDEGATLREVPLDHEGNPRPQGRAFDIGVYESSR